MNTRYRALRIVSSVYRFLGVIVGGLMVIAGVIELLQQYSPNLFLGIGYILAGVIAGLGMVAFGELITLLIDLEANTRATAVMLQRQNKR